MCASYGLGGGADAALPDDLPALSEKEDYGRLVAWMAAQDGRAEITGRRALNLNPLIVQRGQAHRIELGWWSLWVGGRLQKGHSTFNARDDKLLSSPWWRGPFATSRALWPATWYVEKGRRFELPGGAVFTMAALYNVTTINDTPTITYTMVTRSAIGDAATVNPRMPLIVPAGMHDAWLDPAHRGDAELLAAVVASSTRPSQEVQ
jgi:putative SOS response-associated peptidase YedK